MNPKAISQKVWVQVVVTLVLGSLIAALGAVTPGMLAALGPWAPVVFAALTALGAGLSGYMVTDPVRDLGAAALRKSVDTAATPAPPIVIGQPVTGAAEPEPAPDPVAEAPAAIPYNP
ncbi:hypothetical protein [Arthrobacter sp. HY1533]|uniref:hypothetical protein n=1 Tax=Arthrobacter sp. HY1533 TaxID=2970919 RepID=UPI0022B9EAD7|nr:hypothetical protein [Arthrobacter sp. HY1533]